MLDVGRHLVRAMRAELGYTNSGNEMVAVYLQNDEGNGITWYGYFTDATWKRTLEALRLCGWQGDDVSDLSGIDGSREVEVVVEQEEWQGETRVRARWINAPGGAGIRNVMPEADRKSFAARIRERMQSKGNDDDIPF